MVRRRFWILVLVLALMSLLGFYYVRSHPLVFNESLWEHAHCMPQAAGALRTYAHDHAGQFPYHTNGYGDALLLVTNYMGGFLGPLTGPGYDLDVFAAAARTGRHIPEEACGRVYVQGLNVSNSPDIAILFDKVAAPADHCNFPRRLWARFTRDVCFVDAHWETIPAEKWPAFSRHQVDLLATTGLSRAQAEQLFDQAK